jgi:formylglycine-generating enzyme required for sulfatase activity/serine/threonine protein kinase
MGVVYLALDTEMSRLVAFKIVNPEAAESRASDAPEDPLEATPPEPDTDASHVFDALKARFLQEAWVTGGLEHPGIVPVYEMGRTPRGVPYYTMRYVRGQRTLAQAIADVHGDRPADRRSPPASELEARLNLLEPFLKLCDTVAYAHSRGVIHRDLKPRNVALGEFGEVILLDWGLATLTTDEPLGASRWRHRFKALEQVGESVGTPAGGGTPGYMAPEMTSHGGGAADERADVYGLGAILFEILTGNLPHSFANYSEFVRKVTGQEAERARRLDPGIPAALDALCAQALARDPAARLATVGDLAAAVRSWQTANAVQREADARLAEAEAALTRARGLEGDALLQHLDLAQDALARMPESSRSDAGASRSRAEVKLLRARGLAERDALVRRRVARRAMIAAALILCVSAGGVWLWRRAEHERAEHERARLLGENARLEARESAERARAADALATVEAVNAARARLESENARLEAEQAGEDARLSLAQAEAAEARAERARLEAENATLEAQKATARERLARLEVESAIAREEAERARSEQQRLLSQGRIDELERQRREIESRLEVARAQQQVVQMQARTRGLVLGAYALTFGATQPDVGLYLAREAVRVDPSPLAAANLLGALTSCRTRMVLPLGGSPVVALALDPRDPGLADPDLPAPWLPRSGRLGLVAQRDGRVLLLDALGNQQVLRRTGPPEVTGAWFDRAGDGIRVALDGGTVLHLGERGEERTAPTRAPVDGARALGQASDGHIVHLGLLDGRLRLFVDGKPEEELPATSYPVHAALSADGRLVSLLTALGTAPARLRVSIHEVATGRSVWEQEWSAGHSLEASRPPGAPQPTPQEVVFAGDGTTVQLRGRGRTSYCWHWSDSKPAFWVASTEIVLDETPERAHALAALGRSVALRAREPKAPREPKARRAPPSKQDDAAEEGVHLLEAAGAAFTPDTTQRGPPQGTFTILGDHARELVRGCLADDGTEALVVSADGELRRWSIGTWALQATRPEQTLRHVSFGSEGRHALCLVGATIDRLGDEVRMVDLATGRSAELLVGAPQGPWKDTHRAKTRVVRGGSFSDPASRVRTSHRDSHPAARGRAGLGFRVVLALDPAEPDGDLMNVARSAPGTPDWVVPSHDQIEMAGRLGVPVAFEEPRSRLRFVLVPGGRARIGSPPNEPDRTAAEGPGALVALPPYYMSQTEVTRGQHRRAASEGAAGDDGPAPAADDLDPVEGVTHDEASAYAAWVSHGTPYGRVSLPSEVQWEHACRAGRQARWSCGDDEGQLALFAWYGASAGGRAHAVGELLQNAWGLKDMHGNVAEWCSDDWHADYVGAPWHAPMGCVLGLDSTVAITWYDDQSVRIWNVRPAAFERGPRDGSEPEDVVGLRRELRAPQRVTTGVALQGEVGAFALGLENGDVLWVGGDGAARTLSNPTRVPRRLAASADGTLFASFPDPNVHPAPPAVAPAQRELACGSGGKACGSCGGGAKVGDDESAPRAQPEEPQGAAPVEYVRVWTADGAPAGPQPGVPVPAFGLRQVELAEDGSTLAVRAADAVTLFTRTGQEIPWPSAAPQSVVLFDGSTPCLLERRGGELRLRRGKDGTPISVRISMLHATASTLQGSPSSGGLGPCAAPAPGMESQGEEEALAATAVGGRALVDLRLGLRVLVDLKAGSVLGLYNPQPSGGGHCAPELGIWLAPGGDRIVAWDQAGIRTWPTDPRLLLRAADVWLARTLSPEERDLFAEVLTPPMER